METKKLDVVYMLKAGEVSEEFKYSLRSLKNLPHANVWLYGNKPSWVQNVNYVPIRQNGGSKWANTSRMLGMIARNRNISKDFILFNDDFFVLKPTTELEYWYDRTLKERSDECVIRKYPFERYSKYGEQLRQVGRYLKANGQTTKNYELHIPMVLNRKKLSECLDKIPLYGHAARRSLYGNLCKLDSVEHKDVKIYTLTDLPEKDARFVSTTNNTFNSGRVGMYIREQFVELCEYENV